MIRKIDITRDKIYEAAQNSEWDKLIDYLRWSREEIQRDPLLKNAFDNTISGFFNSDWSIIKKEKLIDGLRIIDNFKDRYLSISDSQHKKTIEFLIDHYKDRDLSLAYHYAMVMPELACSKPIINAYKESERKEISHQKSNKIKIDENLTFADVNHTRSLFKSKQEEEFFLAVRGVFQMYTVYPNVAVSTVINFEAIKSSLNQRERNYFFKAVIDTVVVDHLNNFKPIYFFELDSPFHFTDEQKNKDAMKDKIIREAGCKLYRILKQAENVTVDDFKSMIKEIRT